MPDDRLSKLQDAEFQEKLRNLNELGAKVDTKREAEIERRDAEVTRARMALREKRDTEPKRNRKRRKPTPAGRRPRKTTATTAKRLPAKLTEPELLAALENAKADDDVCTAVDQWCWRAAQERHQDEILTDAHTEDRKLTPDSLAAWLPKLDDAERIEATRSLTALYDGRSGWWVSNPATLNTALGVYVTTPESSFDSFPVSVGGGVLFVISESIEQVHSKWLAISRARRPRHPLAPLVDAWRLRPWAVKTDFLPRAILPASLRDVHRVSSRLPLALDRTTPLGTVQETEEQGYLPGMDPPPSLVPAVPWLTLYDLTSTGPMQTRGRGAPLVQRLFVEVLTAVRIPDRRPEWVTAPPITLRDLFEWCWPRWWDAKTETWRGGYERSKHLPLLQRALVELDNLRISHDRMLRRLIRVDDLPDESTLLDDRLFFHVRHLPGSDRGPLIDRASVRRWGLQSAPAYRSTIRLAYLFDELKRRNRGTRIYATRPVVSRGADGVILGADGEPLRDRAGRPVTDWSDRRAVVLGANSKPAGAGNPPAYERNPAADRVPVLGPDDLIRLAFDDNITNSNRRKRLHLSRRAQKTMEAAGEVVLEQVSHGGMRIIEAWSDTLKSNGSVSTYRDTA